MRATWQLQDAKNRLSELVRRARIDGPQTITVRGEPEAVLVSIEDYRASDLAGKPEETLIDFLLASRGLCLELPECQSRRSLSQA